VRILIIEDDVRIASFIQTGLKAAGYAVAHAADGETGLALARDERFDLAILDLMLPGLDGLSVLQALRADGSRMPVIILSAKRSVDDRIRGLQAGGDDYLTKPFSFSELLARIQAMLRRNAPAPDTRFLETSGLKLDLLSRQASAGEAKIELQAKEFALLEYFMRHPGRVLSKTMILEHIWDYDFDPQTNVVDVLVCRVRNKLGDLGRRELIRTLRGVGYVMKDKE
jgi:DNA-binding response OmpR family regulator